MRTLVSLVAGLLLGLSVGPVSAADKDLIQKSIDRGVVYLRSQQHQDGRWHYGEIGTGAVGVTSLAGLTLLECGAKADDPSVQKAAAFVRTNSITLTHTYSLSLAVMFLDRLGDSADVPLLESMAVRLLAGQNAQGGWSYNCPELAALEAQRIATMVRDRNNLVVGKDVPKPGQKREVKDLPREIQGQLEQIRLAGGGGGAADPMAVLGSDNSNTQFATLALWVARRHGIPVERALGQVEARFRASQNIDGGWSYTAAGGGPAIVGQFSASSPAMTAAGLLGLATGYGAYNEAVAKANESKTDPTKADFKAKDPNKDPVIRAGIIALGSAIGNPFPPPPVRGFGNVQPPPPGAPQFRPPDVGVGAMNIPILTPSQNGQGYYFLWSLERVAVAYGLETIGNKDWYSWGCEILLRNQHVDGSWVGQYAAGGADTSFALLFLRRANLAQDLTATLKGKINDPDNRELKAGGIGGTELKKGLGLKPAFGGEKKPEGGAVPEVTTPLPAIEGEAGKLAQDILKETGAKQDELLEKLRDGKGTSFTQALTNVIPRLGGPVKTKARDALAERLTRMTATTLKDKLQDDDLEVRRAAALAVAMKEDKSFIPRLIELIQDPEPPVARAAHAALKSLTAQDFGPEAEATRAERDKAVAAWKAWWAKQGK